MNGIQKKMTKPSETYRPGDVIVIPFPYTDNIEKSKRRPAVVLSEGKRFNVDTGQLVCAMITSSKSSSWPYDVKITDLKAAGLVNPCVIRMKLFTIDQRFVLRRAGCLCEFDGRAVFESLRLTLGVV